MRVFRAFPLSAVVIAGSILGLAAEPAQAKVIFTCTCNDDCSLASPTDVCVDNGFGPMCCPSSSFCPATPGAGIPCPGGTDAAPPGTDAAPPGTDAAGPGTDAATATDGGGGGTDAAPPGTDGGGGTDAGSDDNPGGCHCRVAGARAPAAGSPGAPAGLAALALAAAAALRVRRRNRLTATR